MLPFHYPRHAELITLCDHLTWHWPLTGLVGRLPRSSRVYLSGRYHRRPAVNSAGPHCYVIAAGSSVTHVKVVENEDLIHSTTSLATPSTHPPSLPPSLSLSAWNQSITQSVFPQRCSGPHGRESDGSRDKAAIWQRNSDFMELKDDSQGQMGTRDWTAMSKCQTR